MNLALEHGASITYIGKFVVVLDEICKSGSWKIHTTGIGCGANPKFSDAT